MVNADQFRSAAKLAILNIVKYGDTDIFPFPFENYVFYDKQEDLADLIVEYKANFDGYLARYAPRNVNSLTPVSYSGFRWATQIDSIWNAYFLTCVIALGLKIEEVRIDNPRRGVFFELELDEISREISGRAATELLWTIANSISSGEISR